MLAEVRQAGRGLRRNPGFAALSIVMLGLGVGISAAVFSVVNGVLLQPLKFPEPDRIVSINTKTANRPAGIPRMTGGDFADIRSGNGVFDAVSVYFGGEIGVQMHGAGEFTGVYWVNPEFFKIFGQSPGVLNGQGAFVSEAFAERHFGGAAQAAGKTIDVDSRAYEISGIVRGARFPADAEVWLAAPFIPENLNRTAYNYKAVAHLAPGVNLARAQANLDAIAAQLAAAYPKENGEKGFLPTPLREQLTGSVQSTLYLLLGAVLLVLLIACANVSNLLLARATIRAREIAVRTALGASRARIVRMLAIESLALALCGGLAGIALAAFGTKALVHFAPANLPRVEDIHADVTVLAFAIGISVVSAIVFGVLPALHASRAELSTRGVLRGGSHVLRNSLVVAEIALSFVLATGAGLFFRSFLALNAVDMGFRPENVLVMYAHAPAKGLPQYVAVGREFVDRIVPTLARLPGVVSSAAVMGLPTGRYGSNGSYAVAGKHSFGAGQKLPDSLWALSTPAYFATMKIPLLRGRDFTPLDRYDSEPVVIVNQKVVRDVFAGEDPIGHRIICGLDETSGKGMTIVGVVGDVHESSPGAVAEPMLYMPVEQHPYYANELQVIVRTTAAPSAMTAAVRGAAHRLNPDMALKFTTLDDMISDSIAAPRFRTFLAGAFAVLALALAMAGIYGVMNYIVTQRTSELGLRMALGAAAGDVMSLVLSRAGLLAAGGLAIGAALSLALSRILTGMLFGLKPTDPATYGLVLLCVAAVALAAAAGPALRAA
ncbi:MAG: ABC transporter permease, partial [Acidobacteriota bacterium]|nr:ABC transporter permease [Acidobacteriota bacterium]